MNEVDEDVSVDAEGVALRKTLNDHQFETLAVVFDIRSGRDGPAGVTVRDTIPDGVSAEDIGFHPEYGGEHWRAEGDTVVFSRTFEPGEQYTTVYGVRDFEGPEAALLAEPAVEIEPAAMDGDVGGIDELVSEEDSDLVREVIAGERDSLPGMGGAADTEPPEPESADDWADADVGPVDASDVLDEPAADDDGWAPPDDPAAEAAEPAEEATAPLEDEADTSAAPDEEAAPPDPEAADDEPAAGAVPPEPAEAPAADADEAPDAAEEPADEEAITVSATGGVARVLAKELRAGNVSREDRRLLREELLPDEGSTDARIKRLQTQVADLAAYTDALEAFLDEEGGAEAVIGELEADLDDMADDLDAVEDTVEDVSATVDSLTSDVASVEEEVSTVAAEVDAVADTTERLDDDVAELRSEVGQVDDLDRRLRGIQDDVSDIQAELEELATFRDRLSSVFGSGGMGGGMGGDAPDEPDR